MRCRFQERCASRANDDKRMDEELNNQRTGKGAKRILDFPESDSCCLSSGLADLFATTVAIARIAASDKSPSEPRP